MGLLAFLELPAGTSVNDVLSGVAAEALTDSIEKVRYWHSMALVLDAVRPQFVEQGGDFTAAIETVLAADGLDLGYSQLVHAVVGGDGDEPLRGRQTPGFEAGGTGSDMLLGGAGDDLLAGGGGDDLYLFGRGQGQDRIQEYFPRGSSVGASIPSG